VFRALSLCTCRRHCPGAASERIALLIHPDVSIFPIGLSGRPAHCPFRRLLGVHSRCGLLQPLVTSMSRHFGCEFRLCELSSAASSFVERAAGTVPAFGSSVCNSLPSPLSDLRMNQNCEYSLSKVPEVTLVFWIIKIAATTLARRR